MQVPRAGKFLAARTCRLPLSMAAANQPGEGPLVLPPSDYEGEAGTAVGGRVVLARRIRVAAPLQVPAMQM